MEINRANETGAIPFRTGRFFIVNSHWYFSCRESIDHGPYHHKDDALHALKNYIHDVNTISKLAINKGYSVEA